MIGAYRTMFTALALATLAASTQAFAQDFPPPLPYELPVVSVETLPGAGLDGDGWLLLNPANGLLSLVDAGHHFHAIVSLPLLITFVDGSSTTIDFRANTYGGTILPGLWNGAEEYADSDVEYLGRQHGSGNPTALQSPVYRAQGIGFGFQDGDGNRPGSAYIHFAMRFNAVGLKPIGRTDDIGE